ncbi:MAG: hypothetical protein ABIK84_05345 [candidate division WOR-3 bacterium]
MKRYSILLFFISLAVAQEIVWIRTFRAIVTRPDIAVDSRSNIVVVAYPYLRKYSLSGELLWERRINFGDSSRGPRIDLDGGDSIIVGGYGAPTHHDSWVIMKWTPEGETLWKRLIGFHPDSLAYLTDVGVDNQNNILVTGNIPGTYKSMWLTYKLSPDGEIKWVKTFTSQWGPDRPTGICSDDSLNVIVGGERGILGIPRSWYPQVYKYSKDGDSLWVVYYDDTIHHNYLVGELNVDKLGNVILPGEETGYPPTSVYTFLFKYDPRGNTLWRWFDRRRVWVSGFSSCVTDTAGNIFTAGLKVHRPYPYDTIFMEVWKFSPEGESIWVFPYLLGSTFTAGYPWFEIDLDREGDIIVAAPKETLVYLFKITERSITPEDRRRISRQPPCPTLFLKRDTKMKFFLNEIYDRTGRLLLRDNKEGFLNTLPEGIYFLRGDEERKKFIKVILLD